MSRLLEDQGSIPDRVELYQKLIKKIKKKQTVLDAALFNTQHYMVGIKSKVKQSRELSSTLPYTSM